MPSTLTPAAVQFITDRHLGVLSTFGHRGGIHAVPVGFTVEGNTLRIITSDGTQKVRNAERGGHATVTQVDGARWVSLAGSATINRDADAVAHAVRLYASRYREPRVNPIRVVIEVHVEKVLGSASLLHA